MTAPSHQKVVAAVWTKLVLQTATSTQFQTNLDDENAPAHNALEVHPLVGPLVAQVLTVILVAATIKAGVAQLLLAEVAQRAAHRGPALAADAP